MGSTRVYVKFMQIQLLSLSLRLDPIWIINTEFHFQDVLESKALSFDTTQTVSQS